MIPPIKVNPLNPRIAMEICPSPFPIACAVSGLIFFIASAIEFNPPGSVVLMKFSPTSSKSLKKSTIPCPTFCANGASASQKFFNAELSSSQ